jgi:hypothetical protein
MRLLYAAFARFAARRGLRRGPSAAWWAATTQTVRACLAVGTASVRAFPTPTWSAVPSELPARPMPMVSLLVRITWAISRGPGRRAACASKLRDGTDRQLDRLVGQLGLHFDNLSHDTAVGDRATFRDAWSLRPFPWRPTEQRDRPCEFTAADGYRPARAPTRQRCFRAVAREACNPCPLRDWTGLKGLPGRTRTGAVPERTDRL